MPTDETQFRVATPDDWPAIWSIFREVIRAGDTYMYPPDMEEADARAAWMPEVPMPRRATFVALVDGSIVGTAVIKPNTTGLGDHVANGAWMVSAAARGRGIGRRFAEYAIDYARGLGFHGMQFNAVVASNHNAIALWKSLGFEIVGTVPDAFRHTTLGLTPVHIMYRRL
jgi:L-amino acid N-acyltransferase YncA